jgi:hypothetical protein
MKNFLVLFQAPASVLADWAKTDPAQRKSAEEKMQAEWQRWMKAHERSLADKGAGVGKTKRVTVKGTADAKNDIMFYSIVEAESQDAAAKVFQDHPHLQIPQASIEVMAISPMSGM